MSAREATKGKFRVIAMDHTHCFTCGRAITKVISNIDRVRDTRLCGHFPEFRPYLTHEAVRTFEERLLGLSKQTAESFLAGIPPSWDLSVEIRHALVEFLKDRASFVGPNIRQLLVDQGEL